MLSPQFQTWRFRFTIVWSVVTVNDKQVSLLIFSHSVVAVVDIPMYISSKHLHGCQLGDLLYIMYIIIWMFIQIDSEGLNTYGHLHLMWCGIWTPMTVNARKIAWNFRGYASISFSVNRLRAALNLKIWKVCTTSCCASWHQWYCHRRSLVFINFNMSLRKMLNKINGPRIEPRGTPLKI